MLLGNRTIDSEVHWFGYERLWGPSYISDGFSTIATSGRGVSHLPHCGNLGEFTLILSRLAIWWDEPRLALVLGLWGRGRGFGVRRIEVRIVG